jgi:hypothetical protein
MENPDIDPSRVGDLEIVHRRLELSSTATSVAAFFLKLLV